MRILIIFSLFYVFVHSTKHTNSLTESMGQEVIEIGAPIKEVPDLEEEPSAESDEDKSTTTTIQVATQKQIKKITKDPANKMKDVDKIDGRRQEDEEARIEKELADIYKDSADYKADSGEVTTQQDAKGANTTEADKPIARARHNFKFEPDSTDPKDIARFRTSIDEISCKKTQLSGVTKVPESNSGCRFIADVIFILPIFLFSRLC